MDIQVVFEDALRMFKSESLILVPCLYVLLWLLYKTPLIKKFEWIFAWVLLVIGAAFSVLLEGFSFYHVLRGFFAAGMAVYLYDANEMHRRNTCKCRKIKKD
jgi:uncharacterized membrane protein